MIRKQDCIATHLKEEYAFDSGNTTWRMLMPGGAQVVSRLLIVPNTGFGAGIVQEILGINRTDRTFVSYVFRGFGWMMDVREQL